jgi:glycosyltransferase involved in cell wall biosynthesis
VHDHVRLLDDAEIGMYLRAADVAVLPYRDFHSQSGAAMAAVGAGLPLVVSDVPSLRALAPPRLRAAPGDAVAFAAAVRSWMDDPVAAPSAPSWAEVARLTVGQYRRAIAAARRA